VPGDRTAATMDDARPVPGPRIAAAPRPSGCRISASPGRRIARSSDPTACRPGRLTGPDTVRSGESTARTEATRSSAWNGRRRTCSIRNGVNLALD